MLLEIEQDQYFFKPFLLQYTCQLR